MKNCFLKLYSLLTKRTGIVSGIASGSVSGALPCVLSGNRSTNLRNCLAIVFCFCALPVLAQSGNTESTSTSHLDLSSNECLKQLNDNDIVIASIAFTDGLNSAAQLNELLKRKPWGVGTPATADEIKSQLEVKSPFLIISLTKKQVLTLDDHRDIIKWVLVQSTTTTCG